MNLFSRSSPAIIGLLEIDKDALANAVTIESERAGNLRAFVHKGQFLCAVADGSQDTHLAACLPEIADLKRRLSSGIVGHKDNLSLSFCVENEAQLAITQIESSVQGLGVLRRSGLTLSPDGRISISELGVNVRLGSQNLEIIFQYSSRRGEETRGVVNVHKKTDKVHSILNFIHKGNNFGQSNYPDMVIKGANSLAADDAMLRLAGLADREQAIPDLKTFLVNGMGFPPQIFPS
jgi:hypothetical protein